MTSYRSTRLCLPAWAATALMLLASCQPSTHLSQSANRTMRREADRFLAAMPAQLQERQAQAIRQAMAGDHTALESVRNSRNTAPEISKDVSVRTLSPTLRLYEPAASAASPKPLPLLIYLHGGGWTIGSLNSCGNFCNSMAASGRMKVLAVDYRLAPEHPFPQGLGDCTEAVEYAAAHAAKLGIDAGRISIGGDSSGGNLAIATALSPGCHGKIAATLLFYPVTKAYADGSASWQAYGKGYALDADIMETFNAAYLCGGTSARDARISVGLCPDSVLQRLPRTLLIAAGRDILRDQGEEFAQRLPERITRVEFPQAVHLFITVPGQAAAFEHAVRMATDFLTKDTDK